MESLVAEFPTLCEAPAKMFGSDGQPLPPTKQQEITDMERQVRKEAICLHFKGSFSHSLLNISIIMESRNIVWRRVEGMTMAHQRPAAQALDSSRLDPWLIQLNHGHIGINDVDKFKLRKTLEVSHSQRMGKCDACEGSKVEKCHQCKGADADECWWCKGTGKKSGYRCRHCAGIGKMTCRTCNGSITSTCRRCQGEGRCLYAAFLIVSMSKIDLDPLPLSHMYNTQDSQLLTEFCVEKTRELVKNRLRSSELNDGKEEKSSRRLHHHHHHHREHRVHQVYSILQKSTSKLIQLDIPGEGKLTTNKKASIPTLRPINLFQRKVQFSPTYFILPSDPTLSPVRLSLEEFQASLKGADKVDDNLANSTSL